MGLNRSCTRYEQILLWYPPIRHGSVNCIYPNSAASILTVSQNRRKKYPFNGILDAFAGIVFNSLESKIGTWLYCVDFFNTSANLRLLISSGLHAKLNFFIRVFTGIACIMTLQSHISVHCVLDKRAQMESSIFYQIRREIAFYF